MKNSKSNPKKKPKLPQLSAELTSVIFSAMLFALEDKNRFMSAIPALISAPGNKDNLEIIERIIKKNLDQSITFVCLLGLSERLLRQESSTRATVSIIYMVYRIVSNQNNEELSKREYQQIWEDVWSFASQIPVVAGEIKEKEKINDLQDWKSEVQVFARRRWRTLKDEQMPRVKTETDELRKRVTELLNIKPD